MNADPAEGLIGGCTVDLFDSKMCLRQGYFSAQVYKKKMGDLTAKMETPGFTTYQILVERNNLLHYKT